MRLPYPVSITGRTIGQSWANREGNGTRLQVSILFPSQRKDTVNPKVQELNELLVQELGRNSQGSGMYAWHHSDTWIRPMRVVDVVDGEVKPRYEPKLDPESGLYKAEPVYIRRHVCMELKNQYVMAVWMVSGSFQMWRQMYGDNLEWPKGGEYFPVSHPRGLVCLPAGVVPDVFATWDFIHVVRKDREQAAEHEARLLAKQISQKKDEANRISAELGNLLGAYPGDPSKRGERGYAVWSGIGIDLKDKRPN